MTDAFYYRFPRSCCDKAKLVNKSHDKHWPHHMTKVREMQQRSKHMLAKTFCDASANLCSLFLGFLFYLVSSLTFSKVNRRTEMLIPVW